MRRQSVHVMFWCFVLLISISALSVVPINPNTNSKVSEDQTEIRTVTPFKVAIAEEDYDDMRAILDDMSIPYTDISYYSYNSPTLENLNDMRQYDLIFLPCGGDADDPTASVANNIKQYVQEGGVIYTSDWAAGIMIDSFPGKINFDLYEGDGDTWANGSYIVDDALRQFVGKSYIDIYYDLGAWDVITSVNAGVEILIRGEVQTYGGPLPNAPIAVKFIYGLGTVIYTTFHNEAQVTEDVEKVLAFYVQSLLGYTLLDDIYRSMASGEVIQTWVANLTQGQNLQLNLTDETLGKMIGHSFFDVFLNWQGSAFSLFVNGTKYSGQRPLRVTLSTNSLEATNITIYADQTDGPELCAAAFIVNYVPTSGGIPGFEFLVCIIGLTALILVFLKRKTMVWK